MPSLSQTLGQIPLLSLLHPLLNHNRLPPSTQHNANHCPNPASISCPFPPPRTVNTCCLNHPSGHFLQTQFWDTSPSLGPSDSWTIHGLWPDLCTGGFDAFCDSSRSHSDIRSILDAMDPRLTGELLPFMDKYWRSIDGDAAHLWAHEWNKHGTCISTLEPACYSALAPSSSSSDNTVHPLANNHLDVLDYFIHTTSLFRTLDTYTILAEAGILPSHHQRYTLSELEDALESSAHGYPVTFRCNRKGELDEAWFHFEVKGSLRHSHSHDSINTRTEADSDSGGAAASPFLNASAVREIFIPTGPDGIISNCPRRGIKYLPKSSSNEPEPEPSPTATSSSTVPTTTSLPFTGKGYLGVHVLKQPSLSSSSPSSFPYEQKGCLIRLGTWYTSGSCAVFRAQPDVVDPGHASLFSLSSSYSPCLVDPTTGKFECTKSAAVQGIFSSDHDDQTVLAYRNQSTFYADHVPGRFEKVDIYSDDRDGEREVEVEIHWVAV